MHLKCLTSYFHLLCCWLQIFTDRPTQEPPSERLRPDTVIDYLHRFPTAVITYLEYLVFQRKLEASFYRYVTLKG